MNNAYYNLKNKSQKFIKSDASLKEVEINSIKDFNILMNTQLKEASNVILKYGENDDFDGKYFLTETLFYIIVGFRLDLLRKTVNSLDFFNYGGTVDWG
ncbi:hypothetical protein ATZ36_06580 [Candidatus Endomicrobiellum trichonymphae]|uniref:Uncharacterized protein n=1 Tax=Endomicrobium trichonymphae TaxID=1408204 RepID=A0A1E5IJ53_ENDTX|nr:hypothetical protein ATZ36_06580 [Candidatus Endomicrobium trichonymphae]